MKDFERNNVSLVLARLLDAYERRERLAVTTNPDGSVTFRPLSSHCPLCGRNHSDRECPKASA